MTKYGAQRTYVNGIPFASKREANRYTLLLLLERGGYLTNLELQPVYPLEVNGKVVGKYVADFRYLDCTEKGKAEWIVEDCKGVPTPVYKLKKRMMDAQYGITIRET
tara:strand:- start:577 stop:897 length:321 start_codon:yes stop_codon:yes gene_type:complete